MTELRKAAEMALEALQANYLLVNGDALSAGLERCLEGYYSDSFDIESVNKQTDEAITSLRQALEQPEQTVSLEEYKRLQRLVTSQGIRLMEYESKQEPVANIRTWRKNGELHAELWNWDRGIESLPDGEHDLYTRPQAPATPLHGEPLTDEDIDDIWNHYCDEMGDASINDSYEIARAIEAKLKEKNT